ncbi:MAG: ATP-binding cassette domain-containing protein, partial [Methylococcaceae bacterium]|nr:ATP-binding cassette domain-containing protein [Methylococcaceae bacterium]
VIRGLSLSWIEPGIRLVAGANGVGKSTLLALLGGALAADSGDIHIGGSSLKADPDRARRNLSYCPPDCPVFPFLTGRDWLSFVRPLRRGWNQNAETTLIGGFRLDGFLDTRFDRLSLGTARKLLLVGAIAAETDVLILDEPSNGLDAQSLRVLQHTLREQAATRLIVMACHDDAQHPAFGITTANTLLLQ